MHNTSNRPAQFDVCILCALAEEAEAFITALETQCRTHCLQGFSQAQREYRYANIYNHQGEALSILISWLPDYGLLETGLHLPPLLREFQPRFAGMTGICAGDKRKVKLGDIVVADRAFMADRGKIIVNEDGQPEQRYDTYTPHSPRDILHFVRMFHEWEQAAAILPRPASQRQQCDWLLNTLLHETTSRIDTIPSEQLNTYAPNWRKIVQKLQQGPDPFLTEDRTLRFREKVLELRYSADDFPFQDPPVPGYHIAPMGSCTAVRSDNPFDFVQVPVRNTLAIDMEGAAFYQVCEDFPGLRSLLVKGVCDYADAEKDDTYHQYAARASALYMLEFIQHYVTETIMPSAKMDNHHKNRTIGSKKYAASELANSIEEIHAETLHLSMGQYIDNNHVYNNVSYHTYQLIDRIGRLLKKIQQSLDNYDCTDDDLISEFIQTMSAISEQNIDLPPALLSQVRSACKRLGLISLL